MSNVKHLMKACLMEVGYNSIIDVVQRHHNVAWLKTLWLTANKTCCGRLRHLLTAFSFPFLSPVFLCSPTFSPASSSLDGTRSAGDAQVQQQDRRLESRRDTV